MQKLREFPPIPAVLTGSPLHGARDAGRPAFSPQLDLTIYNDSVNMRGGNRGKRRQ